MKLFRRPTLLGDPLTRIEVGRYRARVDGRTFLFTGALSDGWVVWEDVGFLKWRSRHRSLRHAVRSVELELLGLAE